LGADVSSDAEVAQSSPCRPFAHCFDTGELCRTKPVDPGAKGGAAVKLEADGDATILHYTVNAQIGGKLAQLGGRLIDATSKKLAGDFFEKFSSIVGPAPEGEEEKKKGWFGKLLGSSTAVLVAGTLLVPTCCLTGHVHAADDVVPFPMCVSR